MSHGAAVSLRGVCHCLVGTLCCLSVVFLLLPWSHGHGQQQDGVSSVLLSLQYHAVLLSPCSCVSPQVLRYVADQGETFCLRCAWNCLKDLKEHCHVNRMKAGDMGEESPVKNEMALLCPKRSHCRIRSSDCKLVFDEPVYCQLTHSPVWHTCTSMWETRSRSTISNQAKISVKSSLFISAVMTKLHTPPTDKGEIAQLVNEIPPIIYPESSTGKASLGTHWLNISGSQSFNAVTTLHFQRYIYTPNIGCYQPIVFGYVLDFL